jgi:hypothetical protein
MEETLVSYTTAVLAKEKGFNLRTESLYRSATQIIYSIHGYDFDIAAPTQTALQKWLREEYNIHVWVSCTPYLNSYTFNYNLNQEIFSNNIKYVSHDKALEVGLNSALALITDLKTKKLFPDCYISKKIGCDCKDKCEYKEYLES